jgi:hypothetical protein
MVKQRIRAGHEQLLAHAGAMPEMTWRRPGSLRLGSLCRLRRAPGGEEGIEEQRPGRSAARIRHALSSRDPGCAHAAAPMNGACLQLGMI